MAFDDLEVVERVLKIRDAEASLIPFTEFTMPDPRAPETHRKTGYQVAAHHRFMAALYEEIERGEAPFVITNAPPAHGKSELGTRRFAAWYAGRNPGHNIIIGSYNEKKATDFRDEILQIIASDQYQQVFPDVVVVKKETDCLHLSTGGRIFFVGRGNSITGRHADLIIIDDPIKDADEARSDDARAKLWTWFTRVVLSRRRTDTAAVCVTQTRWTEDDLTGRLTDPSNPFFSKELNRGIKVVNLPAFAEQGDPMGREEGEPLWPKRFGRRYLNQMRDADAVGFAALYQCRPAPEDGIFYTNDIISEYDADEMPKMDELAWYGACDMGIGVKQVNDPSCIIPWGVSEDGTVWISKDIKWDRIPSNVAAEFIVGFMKTYQMINWYMARGSHDGAIGPFIRQRMLEEQCWTPIVGMAESVDKLQRAHSARARCAQGKIRFPRNAAWWPRAKEELLKFPNGSNDDFVDTLSLIGMACDQLLTGRTYRAPKEHRPGTFGFMLKEEDDRIRRERNAQIGGGW